MIKLNDLLGKDFAVRDNGDMYYPDKIHLELYNKDPHILALFNQEDCPDNIKEIANKTFHEPFMYAIYFNMQSCDDIVEIVEI